jgi:hypothetical protein
VQVTRKLVALCVQAQQQHAPVSTQLYPAFALSNWLKLARTTRIASRLQASVRRQLQESELLQHLAVSMAGAADELNALTGAGAAGNPAACNSASGGGIGGGSTTASGASRAHLVAVCYAGSLLDIYSNVDCLVPPAEAPCADTFLPAASAAARLIMAVLRACSLQSAAGCESAEDAIHTAYITMHNLAADLIDRVQEDQQLPCAQELLLSPDLVPCLAINVVVTLLALETATDLVPDASGSRAAAGSTPCSGSSSVSGQRQQGSGHSSAAPQPLDDSSAGLASLTPLAAGFFDLLGVDKAVAVKAAGLAKSNRGASMDELTAFIQLYNEVLAYQVGWCVRAANRHQQLELCVARAAVAESICRLASRECSLSALCGQVVCTSNGALVHATGVGCHSTVPQSVTAFFCRDAGCVPGGAGPR